MTVCYAVDWVLMLRTAVLRYLFAMLCWRALIP